MLGMQVLYWKSNIFTIRNSVDVDSSGSYVCADQEPHFLSLRTQEDLQNTDRLVWFREKGVIKLSFLP